MNASFTTDAARWQAIRRRDARADDRFFYSVRTTGVFCRPSCSARLPRRENVAFHASSEAARRAGFRPCQRCRPDLPPKAEREAAVIAVACRRIESSPELPTLEALAKASDLSAHHFHRLFKRITGVTPRAYAAAHRQGRVQQQLAKGTGVTRAFYDAGFSSAGRFYEHAPAMLGMTPRAYGRQGEGERIWYGLRRTSLGQVLVAATQRGICAILLGDDERSLVKDLRARFARATLDEAPGDFTKVIARVVRLVDAPATTAQAVPLDIRGTAFQRRVWEALQAIAPGETMTYTALAAAIGQPRAVRAVASACAANAHAVAIPCHRVIARDGALSGYRWGLERKRALMERERRAIGKREIRPRGAGASLTGRQPARRRTSG